MPYTTIIPTPAASTSNVQPPTVVRPGLEQRSQRPTQHASIGLANLGMRQNQWVVRPHQDTGAQPRQRAQPHVYRPATLGMRQNTATQTRYITVQQPHVYLPASRHTASTFSGQNAHIQQPNPTTPEQKPGISLNAKGQPDFQGFNPPALTDLLKSILGQPKQTYQAQHNLENGQEHLLLDQQGSVLHLKQSPTAFVVLRSSQAEGPSNASTRDSSTFELHGNSAQIATGVLKSNPLEIPGKAHLAQLTGIHEENNGEQLRVHEGRLHHFNASTASWEPKPGSEGKVLSQLSTHGNGAVYGQGDDMFKNLKTFSVAPDSVAACLVREKDRQGILLVDVLQESRPLPSRILELNDGKSEALSVGLSNDRLFIADTEGKLYSVGRNELNTGERSLNLAPEQDYQPAGEQFGAGKQVTGFMHGDDGALHILVTDRSGQTHAHPLDEQSKGLKSGWNLTDALVLDNKRGLAGAADPTPANTFDLGPSGRVGITDKRIQQWDSTTQGWKDTGIKGVEQLQQGADSKAYMLKDGKIAKLDVSPCYTPVTLGTSHTLTQASRSTKVSPGDELPGLENRTVTTFAMLNDKQFVACDDQNRLTAHHKTGNPSELTHHGLPDNVSSLALDENHNLHALTTQGELFVLAKDDWQAPEARPDASWKPVVTSDHPPRLLASIRTADDSSLSATLRNEPGHSQVQLKHDKWQPLIPRPADHNALNDLFANVRGGEKSTRIPFTGGAVRVASSLMGRNSMESNNQASTREFIRANIFKGTLETPRTLKNIGNNIQHHHHGREGLRPIYDAESKLFERLDMIHKNSGKAPEAGNDFKSRIARLALGAPGAGLLKDLEAFRTELEDNSHRATIHLGHQHGQSKLLRQKEGLLNIHGEVSGPSKRTALSMALSNASEKLNLNSSGHDLLKELQDVLTKLAPSAENHTGALLKTLQDNGMKIAHQRADVPLGQRRDASDGQALTKARLTLDVVTLKDFGVLLDNAEMLIPGADNGKKLGQLQEKFSLLRDKTYARHPIKQVTDMGFTDHISLENSYDAIKAFLKGFKKDDHATSVNLRAATSSKSQAELADKLKASLKQLEHPDDEISLQRGYGLSLNTPFIGLAQLGTGPFPSGSVAGGRNYSLKFARGDKGITADISHAGIGTASAGVGASKNFWPDTRIDIGHDRTLTPAFRLGVDLTATATATQHHGVVFTVPDEDIDHFVDNLFSGKLNPLEVMTKGVDHTTQNGMHLNLDLNASGTAELNVGLGITDKNSSPLSVASRFGLGGTVNVNLLNFTDYSLSKSSDKSELREGGMNRPRLMNKLDAGVYLRTALNAGHTGRAKPPQTPASQSITAPFGVNLGVSADSKTTKRIQFTYTEAKPLTTANLTKLSGSLGTAFKDRASQTELGRLADDRQPEYAEATPKEKIQLHLEGLSQYFSDKPVANDDQYAALRALKRSSVQLEAADKKHSMLDSARFESSYTNLSRLSEQGVVSKVMSSVNSMHSPSNAERVSTLLRDDPTLKSLVKQLQSSDGTLARVRLELKDHVQDKIDEGSRTGTLSQTSLAALLADRDNMRIKAITVFQSASQKEGFTSPLPVLGYNSTASLSVSKTLGKISFSYGQDQDTPKNYVLDGELARPTESLKSTAGALKKDGFELKS